MQVLVDDARKCRVVISEPEAAQRVGQRLPRHVREIFVALHQRTQPGIFQLLDAPDLGDDFAVAGKGLFGNRSHRLDVVERAIGIEHDGFDIQLTYSLLPIVASRNSWSATIDWSVADWLNSRWCPKSLVGVVKSGA